METRHGRVLVINVHRLATVLGPAVRAKGPRDWHLFLL